MTARATFDPARELDLFLRINRDATNRLNFLDTSGGAYDLVNRTFVLNIKQHASDSTNFLQLTSVSGLAIGTSTIDIAITKVQAAKFREQYYFWELVTTKDGLEKNWLTGYAWFHNGKFDGVSNLVSNVTIYDRGQTVNITINETGGGGMTTVTDFNMTASLPLNPTAGVRYRIVLPSPFTPVQIGNVSYQHFQIIEYTATGYWIAYSNNTSDQPA